MVCAILPATVIYSFHRHFPRFTNTFLLYRWIHPSAVLVCFGVYPPHCHSVMLALRDEFFHTSVPVLMYYIRLGFTLQPISSFSFLFASVCLWCEDTIMFSLYLSLKVDYRRDHRPVICRELTY